MADQSLKFPQASARPDPARSSICHVVFLFGLASSLALSLHPDMQVMEVQTKAQSNQQLLEATFLLEQSRPDDTEGSTYSIAFQAKKETMRELVQTGVNSDILYNVWNHRESCLLFPSMGDMLSMF